MSDLARRLIAANKQSRAPFLDLGNCGLTTLPDEIGELVWLESLTLAAEWSRWDGGGWSKWWSRNQGDANSNLTDVTALAALSNLREVFVSNTQLTDIRSLAALPNLERLDISRTAIADFGPLAKHDSLRVIDAAHTRVDDLSPLMRLLALEYLDIGHSRVTDLTALAGLMSLVYLDVSFTAIGDLEALKFLPRLRRVDAESARINDLTPLRSRFGESFPVGWLDFSRSTGLDVGGCPLTTPPAEIAKQGTNAVLNYFRERDTGGVDHLYEAKLLILGDPSAGKTTLLRRLYRRDLSMPAERETTRGIDIHRHEFTLKNGRTFRLNVWDFGGQEIYHATHQFFLTKRSLYLLLDDTRKDHKSVSDEGFKYWLEMIDLFSDHSPVLIFQNEKGGRSKAIDLDGIRARFGNVKERYAGNLEQQDAAATLCEAIEFFASQLSHIGEELPARWIRVRDDIEKRAAETPYITQQEYFEIYDRHLPSDRTKALHLSRYLHDLGVFLHFQDDPLLARIVVLQNEWATEAVFRILDDEGVKARLGRFGRADCARAWRDSKYADMHPELVALMQHFELCYALPDAGPATWLLPQLLPPTKPALTTWTEERDRHLVLRYRYDFMPRGLVSRLTVRLHRFVRDPELAWRTGVLFEREDTSALVEVLPDGRELEMRARGPERKALLSVVSADLDALNDSFQGLGEKVDKRIPCNCSRCATSATPEFFAQRALQKRRDAGRRSVECESSYEQVDVLELLDGIRTDALPVWAHEARATPTLRRFRVFLASSSELHEDRDAFDLYFRQQNDRLIDQGLYVQIDRWEHFLDAISDTRLQDEYNKAVRAADVVVFLFFTKAGAFTEEEFDVAHAQFKSAGKPHIFTFFKNAAIMTGDDREDDLVSLSRFKKKLKGLGHYHTVYTSVEHLQLQFLDQLDRLQR